MFDVGWTEMLVIACVAIIVVGPKDLPGMLRTFGKTIKGVKGMASDFQKQFDDALREADLEDVKSLASKKSFAPLDDVTKSAKDFQNEVRARLNDTHKDINAAIKDDKDVAVKLPDPVSAPVAAVLPSKETENAEIKSGKTTDGKKKAAKSVSKPSAKTADKLAAKASIKPDAKVAAAKSTKSKQVKNS